MNDLEKTREQLISELGELRESVEKFEAIMKESSYGYAEYDLDGNFTFINKKAQEMTGQNLDTHPELNIRDVIFEEDMGRMFKDLALVLTEPNDGPRDYRFKTTDGSIKHVEVNTLPIRKDGEIIGFQGTAHDITERKQALESLQESESMYRLLAENVSDVIWIMGMDLNFIYISPSIERLRGYTVEEVLKQKINEILAPSSLDTATKIMAEEFGLKRKGDADRNVVKTFEWEEICKDGSTVWVEDKVSFLRDEENKPVGILGVTRDISERKKAAQALREMTDNFTGLYEAAFEGIIIHDNGHILDLNNTMAKIFGYERSEIIGTSMLNYADIGSARLIREKVASGSEDTYEAAGIRKDGSKIIAEITGKPFTYKGLDVRLTSVRDITERKRAEEALRESENLYRTLVETSPDAIILTDLELNIIMASPRSADLMRFDNLDDLIGKNALELIVKEEQQRAIENTRKLFETGNTGTFEYTLVRHDGTEMLTELNSALIYDNKAEPKAYIGVIRDITEKRKMEEELLKVGKLESIGFLAGGIAHDFNNILTGIIGNVNLAKFDAESNKKVVARLVEVEKAALRATNLTNQLLTFSKGGAPIKETANIAGVITDTADFVLSGSDVRCDVNIPADLWAVEFDVGQISQVINNLAINSKQAMPEGGTIKVDVQNMALEKKSGLPIEKGKYIKISFNDRGVGIKRDHLSKIFDPYFTTKREGSGLGLTTSYSIIRKHGGHISVESVPGEWTTLHIYLPASEAKLPPNQQNINIELKGTGKVLLMDDEEVIRISAGGLIEYLGYEVEYASDGLEAVELYEKAFTNGCPFDVIIMDLTVPGGMGGEEAIRKILEIDPEARAIVSSGYSKDPIMAQFEEYGFRGILIKPYETEGLGRIIKSVISLES